MLVLFASWVTLELAVFATNQLGIIPWLTLHLAFLLVLSGLVVGIHRMALVAIDGAAPSLRALPDALRDGPTFLLAGAIYTLAVVAGLLMLVAPGIYVATRLSLFPEVIAAKHEAAWNALGEAVAMTRGSWWLVFRVQLVLLVLNACGAALLGIGFLVSFPVSIIAAASLYRGLSEHPQS
jgi:hypothetical protein